MIYITILSKANMQGFWHQLRFWKRKKQTVCSSLMKITKESSGRFERQ